MKAIPFYNSMSAKGINVVVGTKNGEPDYAERLAIDPAMRQMVGGRAIEHTASSTSRMSRFETEALTAEELVLEDGWTCRFSAL